MQFLGRLDQTEVRFEELTRQLADPAIISDADQYRKAAKAHSELADVVAKYREWKEASSQLEQARLMVSDADAEMRQMAQEEIVRLEPALVQMEEDLKVLLLPKDPNDEKNVVLEIRAGTGGDEATLFAAEIFRMYSRYAESQRWRVELTSMSESSVGGLKEVIALVSGERVYSKLKYESGVQREQLGAERGSMVGTGDRSEKIRTYNFPQNRVTDHRIGLTLHQLDIVMEGRLDPIIEALTAYYQTEKLKHEGVTA